MQSQKSACRNASNHDAIGIDAPRVIIFCDGFPKISNRGFSIVVASPNGTHHRIGNIKEIVNPQAVCDGSDHIPHARQILTQSQNVGIVIFSSNEKPAVRHDNQRTIFNDITLWLVDVYK